MLSLMLIIYIFLGTTLAGSAMIVALTMGYGTMTPLLMSAAIGAVVALPISWAVAKRLDTGRSA